MQSKPSGTASEEGAFERKLQVGAVGGLGRIDALRIVARKRAAEQVS